MKAIRFLVKALWWIGRNGLSSLRLCFYRLLPGTFFRKVGCGTKFFGRIHFGTVEGNISLGSRCMLGHGVFFSAGKACAITIGNDCSLNNGSHIVALYGITIGSDTRIGEYCTIRDQNHGFEKLDVPIHQQGFEGGPVNIGRGVWIGRGVFIGPGVTIGDGCIIGANSVVTRDLEAYSVAVGAPAKRLRYRGEIRAR